MIIKFTTKILLPNISFTTPIPLKKQFVNNFVNNIE